MKSILMHGRKKVMTNDDDKKLKKKEQLPIMNDSIEDEDDEFISRHLVNKISYIDDYNDTDSIKSLFNLINSKTTNNHNTSMEICESSPLPKIRHANETGFKRFESLKKDLQDFFTQIDKATKQQSKLNHQNHTFPTIDDLKKCLTLIKKIFDDSNWQNSINLNMNNDQKIIESTSNLNIENELLKEKLQLKQNELDNIKETFEVLKVDRKRLKSERVELLNQAKNLYTIIETKEIEIRDFLKHYEKKTKETSQAVRRLIDTKGEIEKENNDLKMQFLTMLEDVNELKLVVESKNATISKLQKQLFEFKSTKSSPRYSLGKDSDYGYVSSKSRDTLSSSMIESTIITTSTTTTPLNNKTLTNSHNTSVNEQNTTLKATTTSNYLNLSMKSKLNASNLRLKSKKEERSIKCKSNDSFIYLKNNNNSTVITNEKHQKASKAGKASVAKFTPVSHHSNHFEECSDENTDDLNKALLSTTNNADFIDLDSDDVETVPLTKKNSIVSSTVGVKNRLNSIANPKSTFSSYASTTLTNSISPSDSLVLNSLSSSLSSSSYKNVNNCGQAVIATSNVCTNASSGLNQSSELKFDNNGITEFASLPCNFESQIAPANRNSLDVPYHKIFNQHHYHHYHQDNNDSDNILNKTLNDWTNHNQSQYSIKQPLSISQHHSNKVVSRSSKLLQSFMRRKSTHKTKPDQEQEYPEEDLDNNTSLSMLNSKSTHSFNGGCGGGVLADKKNSSIFNTTKSKFATLSRNYKSNLSQSNRSQVESSVQLNRQSIEFIIENWSTSDVKLWMENIGLLSTHVKSALKHIKTGKQLLNAALGGMSDSDLDKIFAIESKYCQMHRRKIRLALNDLLSASTTTKTSQKCKHPKLADISTHWLCSTWLVDVGLVNLKECFKLNLIDGRVLASLQKKDLEKYLGICKRTHQTSLLLAIDLLRKYDFDIKRIESLRKFNRQHDINDAHLWTNDQFADWLKTVNLQLFIKKLSESGLHGGLCLLEATTHFNVDFLYESLGVSEIEPKYLNMKKIIDDEIQLLRSPSMQIGITKSSSFIRMLANNANSGSSAETSTSSKNNKFNLRGSLGRALGKKCKQRTAAGADSTYIGAPLIDDITFKRIESGHKMVEIQKPPPSTNASSMIIPHTVV